MINILILTDYKDAHARIVEAALKKKGVNSVRWVPEEYLTDQQSVFKIDKKGIDLFNIKIESKNINLLESDVVWFRRQAIPNLPKDLHPADVNFVKDENTLHMRSIWFELERHAVCVNPISSYLRSNSKLIQLSLAQNIGLSFPETLISNKREAIQSFIQENNSEEIIYKTFSPSSWNEGDNIFNFYTTKINLDILPEQSILRLTPGIYQRKIKKAFEVRSTFFGDENVSVKIHNSEELDWRMLNGNNQLEISPIKLCPEIEKKCILMMKELNIVFGCFDFIVTPEGEYIFLEVNEMGQFLWIEDLLPELKMLDNFCDFLFSVSGKQAPAYLPIERKKILDSEEYKSTLEKDILTLESE